MRRVNSYEYEQLQKKLERIEQILRGDHCDEIIKEQFELEDIQKIRAELELIFRNYVKQVQNLEDAISQYLNLHLSIAYQMRRKFRILNKNLENNTVSRAILGLPPYRPGKMKLN